METYVELSYLIPLLPLLGAVISGFFGAKFLKGQSHWPIWLGVLGAAFISIGLLIGTIHNAHVDKSHAGVGMNAHWFNWIETGTPGQKGHFNAQAGAWIDPLTAVMLTVVNGIGFLITVFAAGYMKGEKGYFRFFAYLGLFIFSMNCLVMGNNLIMMYLGWEGVGLCSYLLIGYYYDKPAAREAAKKAFLVNRIGDLGFGIGIMLTFLAFGTVSYFGNGAGTNTGFVELIMNPQTEFQRWAVQIIPFCLMLGAFGKSAQFPLYVWLPDAMEGPTPVSALIHAATMVTAGVYMIARCGTAFIGNEAAMITIAFVGAFTALFAGSMALRQFDLKKVFAYSTISQLGFMFVGVAVLAPVTGIFHVVTHAFFKALLFLSSGVVMHAMLGELDMRKMSGLKTVLPKTRWLMLIGCAALAGFPFLSGFYSKDAIIAAAWEHHKLLAIILLLTAFVTAYYTFRLYFRVFEGPTIVPAPPADAHGGHGGGHGHDDHAHGGDHHHNHEPFLLMAPLIVLAVGSLIAGLALHDEIGEFLGRSPSLISTSDAAIAKYKFENVNPGPLGQGHWIEPAKLDHEHHMHLMMMIVSGLIALSGIGAAYYFHLKNRPAGDALPRRFPLLALAIENKYWVDEIYQAVLVEPLRKLGKVLFAIDRIVVDGVVWSIGFVPQLSGFALKLSTQRGYLQGYAGAMMFGIVVVLIVLFW